MGIVVALDAHCLTYYIDAHRIDPSEPVDTLADQKIALLRTFFYARAVGCFAISPTAIDECMRMRDDAKRSDHQSWLDVMLHPFAIDNRGAIERRVTGLLEAAKAAKRHARSSDAAVLAECEEAGAHVLLSYDKRFNGFLREKAIGVQVLRPLEYWQQLGIPRSSTPVKIPHTTNPLANQSWWRW